MSRTVISVKTNASRDTILQFLSVELPRVGYVDKSTANERVWGKGDGLMLLSPRISVNFQPGEVYLSAWVYDTVTGEADLDGLRGKAIKNKARRVLEDIASKISALPAAAAQDVLYCSACGAPCKPGSSFCTRCGNRL